MGEFKPQARFSALPAEGCLPSSHDPALISSEEPRLSCWPSPPWARWEAVFLAACLLSPRSWERLGCALGPRWRPGLLLTRLPGGQGKEPRDHRAEVFSPNTRTCMKEVAWSWALPLENRNTKRPGGPSPKVPWSHQKVDATTRQRRQA